MRIGLFTQLKLLWIARKKTDELVRMAHTFIFELNDDEIYDHWFSNMRSVLRGKYNYGEKAEAYTKYVMPKDKLMPLIKDIRHRECKRRRAAR